MKIGEYCQLKHLGNKVIFKIIEIGKNIKMHKRNKLKGETEILIKPVKFRNKINIITGYGLIPSLILTTNLYLKKIIVSDNFKEEEIGDDLIITIPS